MYVRVRKLDLQSHPIWGRYFVFELEVGHEATSSSLSTVISSFWLRINDCLDQTKGGELWLSYPKVHSMRSLVSWTIFYSPGMGQKC